MDADHEPLNLSDLVDTPLNLRPDLTELGIDEYDRGICEDDYRNRTILRKQHLSWNPIYDAEGQPTGKIEVLSKQMQTQQSISRLEDRRELLDDPNDANADYVVGLELIYAVDADAMVPPWVMHATRDYKRIVQAREDNPDKKIRPNLISYPGRCRYVKSDGIRCLNFHAGRKDDDQLCRTHLGALNSNAGVGAVARARQKIQQVAPYAADVMEEMLYATSEVVRLNAAKELLDRVGVRGGVEVDLNATVQQQPAGEIIAERLRHLRETSQKKAELEAQVMNSEPDSDIIDAEIVQEDNNEH